MITTQKRVIPNLLLNVVSVRHKTFIFLPWKFASVVLKHWRRLLIVTITNSHTEKKEAPDVKLWCVNTKSRVILFQCLLTIVFISHSDKLATLLSFKHNEKLA